MTRDKLKQMSKIFLTVFLFLFLFFPLKGYALLSPYYQSLAEITRIFQDDKLGSKLDSQAINSITRVSNGTKTGWEFLYGPGNECALFVKVRYLPVKDEGFVGPAAFAIEFEEPVCKAAPENKPSHAPKNEPKNIAS